MFRIMRMASSSSYAFLPIKPKALAIFIFGKMSRKGPDTNICCLEGLSSETKREQIAVSNALSTNVAPIIATFKSFALYSAMNSAIFWSKESGLRVVLCDEAKV